MSFADTVSDDYRIFDAAESVTLRTRTEADPSGSTTSITLCLVGNISRKEVAASNGLFGGDETTFRFGADQITSATVPKPGDEFTRASDSTVYEILSADLVAFHSAWKCVTKKQR